MRVVIGDTDVQGKRLKAVFFDGEKKVKSTSFGLKGGSTFIDHKDENKKSAWIARHQVRGNFGDFMSASSLSRYILWNKPTLSASIADYKKKFGFK